MVRLSKCLLIAAVTLGFVFGAAGRVNADIVVRATASLNLSNNSLFGTLDLTTGQFAQSNALSGTVLSLTAGPTGALFAGLPDGHLYTLSGSGVLSQFGSITAPVPPGGFQNGFWGLANVGPNGFFAINVNDFPFTLDRITPDANSLNVVGSLGSTAAVAVFGTGGLAVGPDGALYYNATTVAGVDQLYRVNPATGVATAIGSGLGTLNNDALTLVTANGTLYGVDTFALSSFSPIQIYTINTTTGVATYTGVNVTGLAPGYTLDTVAAIPEPSPLLLAGAVALLGLGCASRGLKGATA